MTVTELRKLEDVALQSELHALLREAFNLRMQQGSGESVKPSLFKKVRRDIARVKTILRQRQAESQ